MASVFDPVLAIFCATIGVACPEEAPLPGVQNEVPKDLYQTFEKPKPKKRIPKPARLTVPGQLAFGTVTVGQGPKSQTIAIGNAGENELVVNDVAVSGSAAYGVTGNCDSIKGGGFCRVAVQFSPPDGGPFKGELLVATPAGFGRVPLIGSGRVPAPAPQVVEPRPKPKPKPKPKKRQPEPEFDRAIASLDVALAQGPVVFDGNEIGTPLTMAGLPPAGDVYHLQDEDYEGEKDGSGFDGNVSTFPVERCRMIPKDTLIPLILDATVNSQICGPIRAHVAYDVFGPDGRVKLIPAGSKVSGQCDALTDPDGSRLEAKFDSITRPDGAAIRLTEATGTDAMGQVGLVGETFDRFVERYAPTAIASTVGAVVAYLTSPETNSTGTTVESPLSAGGEAFQQSIAQIVANELQNQSQKLRRIRVNKGTLFHIIPTRHWYFPNPTQIVEVDPRDVQQTFECHGDAFRDETGRRQNPTGE